MTPRQFQQRLLAWFDQHGRKQLPWQIDKTPYRVWVSEIMLQQTQVSTVIPYYLRFMQRFPDIKSLARASEDDVLHQWTGLGYYTRARNLHKAAQMVVTQFKNTFPDTLDTLIQLPGIGQSTAGAILAIAFAQRATILDGNVKRVLARLHGITNPINEKKTEDILWEQAVAYTPKARVADYTQAIMDLGATVCTRSKPACGQCPLIKNCIAHKDDLTDQIPIKKAGKQLPVKTATFLLIEQDKRILLCKRPPAGIWGGLWSLPEIQGKPDKKKIQQFVKKTFGMQIKQQQQREPFRHTFSHYHLDIHPVHITPEKEVKGGKIMETGQQIWYNSKKPEVIGLPRPIQKLLQETR